MKRREPREASLPKEFLRGWDWRRALSKGKYKKRLARLVRYDHRWRKEHEG